MGADIALFPEMWNVGYTFFPVDSPEGRQRWASQAVSEEGRFVMHFRSLAAELNMAIALTYLQRWPGAPRNAVSIIDRQGTVLMTYAKVHTCDFSLESACTPGDAFKVCTLNTPQGDLRLGAMICYDREFPESARVLMLKGAEIILTPNACTLDENRLSQFRSRAFENMVGVAMANYATPQNNGRSVAFDGIAHDGVDGPPRDMKLIEAGEAEDVYLATFDLKRLRSYREVESWGNAFRKPHAYTELLSEAVCQPFVRPEARSGHRGPGGR